MAEHFPPVCHKTPYTSVDSLEQTTTPLQRALLQDLILHNNMANNHALSAVYALPIKQRNPYPRRSPKHTRHANINRNVRAHLRHDLKRCQDDGKQLRRMQNEYDQHDNIVNSIHRRFYLLGSKQLSLLKHRSKCTIPHARSSSMLTKDTFSWLKLPSIK